MRASRRRLGVIIIPQFAAFFLTACATYNTQKIPATLESGVARKESVVTIDRVRFHSISLDGKEDRHTYLGLDSASSNMVPVLLSVENHGSDPLKVDLSRTFLSSTVGENFKSLTLEESCDRARREGAAPVLGASVLFGLVGATMSGAQIASTNRSLEEDYYQKYFRPTLIDTGSSGRGVLFFDVPAGKHQGIRSLIVTLVNLGTSKTTQVCLDFPP